MAVEQVRRRWAALGLTIGGFRHGTCLANTVPLGFIPDEASRLVMWTGEPGSLEAAQRTVVEAGNFHALPCSRSSTVSPLFFRPNR